MVLAVLFILVLVGIWALLIGTKVHDKATKKVEKFVKNNLNDEKENV